MCNYITYSNRNSQPHKGRYLTLVGGYISFCLIQLGYHTSPSYTAMKISAMQRCKHQVVMLSSGHKHITLVVPLLGGNAGLE